MHTFGRLLGFLRPYKRGVFWSLLLAALAMVCTVAIPWLTGRAVDQISASAGKGPFYLELDYVAPHGDYRPPWGPEPAPRHYDSWAAVPLPRPPGFNEPDVSDKPRFLRSAAPLGPSGRSRSSRCARSTRGWRG